MLLFYRSRFLTKDYRNMTDFFAHFDTIVAICRMLSKKGCGLYES